MAMNGSNDKSKTSKTARVMNLLSKKQDSAPPAQEPAQAPQPPVAEEVQPAAAAPILTPPGADAAVSGQIRNALEDALEEELSPKPAPAPDPAPIWQEAPAPAQEPEPAPAPEPEPEPEPVPAAPEQPAAPVQAEAHADHAAGYVNVMQVLVEEKAPKYMQMFGLCDCDRCMEDVKALALNHLPPKYVVMGEHEMIPKLTFYEGKYSSDITAQLLKACEVVMKTPHHDRQQ